MRLSPGLANLRGQGGAPLWLGLWLPVIAADGEGLKGRAPDNAVKQRSWGCEDESQSGVLCTQSGTGALCGLNPHQSWGRQSQQESLE